MPTLEDLVDDNFKRKVELAMVEARRRALECFGGEAVVLKCKWPDCEEEVSSHKGATAGWCTKLQPNDKTHRQMHLEEMRATDPDYGRGRIQRAGKLVAPPKPADAAQSVRPPVPRSEPFSAPDSVEDGFWLDEVKRSINEALNEVEEAEGNLAEAKERLRRILVQAQEAIQ
jgi:hypothetical protein